MLKSKTCKSRLSRDADGAWVCFLVPEREAAGMVDFMASGRECEVSVKQYHKPRSLDANAYFWVLLGRVSEKIDLPPMEVYREYIQDVGGNYIVVPVMRERMKFWDEVWCEGHDGRLTVDMGPCANVPGYNNVRCYIGSSDYDAAQMSRLIELVIQDCKDLGIETLTPVEQASMMLEWSQRRRDEREHIADQS